MLESMCFSNDPIELLLVCDRLERDGGRRLILFPRGHDLLLTPRSGASGDASRNGPAVWPDQGSGEEGAFAVWAEREKRRPPYGAVVRRREVETTRGGGGEAGNEHGGDFHGKKRRTNLAI